MLRLCESPSEDSAARRLHLGPVLERCIPLTSALRRQVHNIPNRILLVNAALFDVVGQPWMPTVKMAQRAITVSRENRNRRVLMSFAIFAAEIVLESAFAGAQQTEFVPSSFTSVCAQRGRISRGDNRQVNVLREVMSDSIEAIDPGGTHWARIRLLPSVHEVIDHE